MNNVSELIARGGIGEEALSGARIPSFSALLDPEATEELGALLADRLREYQPTQVMTWDLNDEALAFVVARELGITGVRAFDDMGIARVEGPALGPEGRTAIISTAIRVASNARAMKALAEHDGGQLVALAVLVDTPALDQVRGEMPAFALLRPDDRLAQTDG